MHVDDRLATVLNCRTDGKVALRIQYRQLLDLVGTSPAETRSNLLDDALVRLGELASLIPVEERARALSEPGVRLRNPRLIVDLAADHPSVAIAAIRAARLADDQWLDLIPALPLSARGFLRHRSDLGPALSARLEQLGINDRALPPGDNANLVGQTEYAPAPPQRVTIEAPTDNIRTLSPRLPDPAAANSGESQGIGAIVRRIEAFRRSREAGGTPQAANDAPRLPLGEAEYRAPPLRAFAFETDTTGRISWAEAGIAGMAVGLLLPVADDAEAELASAFRRRLPIRGNRIMLEGAPAITGEWQVDATPHFDVAGHFTGYLGRFRRPAPAPVAPGNPEADRIRQVLHELRTPVNAIQGFAEVIHQQLFGATPHEYRALAAGIAADAARMLAGFEELDRLAKLDTGAMQLEGGTCDLAMIVAGLVHQLETFTVARGSGFAFAADPGTLAVPLSSTDAEHLIWRLLATFAGAARPGEVLPLELRSESGLIRLTATLPSALAEMDDLLDAAPSPGAQTLSAGVFGTGFTLRLAAAEARAAGGWLTFEDGLAVLGLPPADLHNTPDVGLVRA